jgi:hypothetical protein
MKSHAKKLFISSLVVFTATKFQVAPRPGTEGSASPPALVLEGIVKGPKGEPLESALVVAYPVGAGLEEIASSALTNRNGYFRLALRNTTPHNLRIEAPGLAARSLKKAEPGRFLSITLEKGYSVTGTVRSGVSLKPVPGARIRASEEGLRIPPVLWEVRVGLVETTTDAMGAFRLDCLAPGLHNLVASARGYGRAEKRSVSPGSSVDFFLYPGSSITGLVLRPGELPLHGAFVQVEKKGQFYTELQEIQVTSASGKFEIWGLESGTYRVAVSHPELPPGIAEVAVAETSEAEVRVLLGRGARLQGRLLSQERPVVGEVAVLEIAGQSVPHSISRILRCQAREDGIFVMDLVPAGSHSVAIIAPGYATRQVEVQVSERDSDVSLGDIELETGLVIRGQVIGRDKTPIVGAMIAAFDSTRASLASMLQGEPQRFEARTGSDGSFVVAGLSPGVYRLDVKSEGYGHTSVGPVEAGTDDIEIVLDRSGAVRGIAEDENGNALQALRASLESAGPGEATFESDGRASPEGLFVLEDVPDGKYILKVEAPGQLRAVVSNVVVVPGGVTNLGRIRLKSGGRVRGLVVDPSDAPIAGASVRVWASGDDVMPTDRYGETSSGTDGLFELRGVPDGVVEIVAQHPNYAQGRASVQVDARRGPSYAQIKLSPGGRLEGWVRKRDGSGVPGVSVQISAATPSGSVEHRTADSGSDGSFAVEHLPSGRALVSLMRGSGAARITGQSAEVDIRDGETSIVEFTSHQILVTGNVTVSGVAAPGLHLMMLPLTRMSVSIRSGTTEVRHTSSEPQFLSGFTRSDGSYQLFVDRPGQYRVAVQAADSRLRYPSRLVDIPEVDSHTLDLSFSGFLVSGIVVQKEERSPISAANVVAMPKRNEHLGVTTSISSPDGTFQLELEPGEYQIWAEAEGYSGEGKDVFVHSGSAAHVELALSRSVQLKGKVVNPRGEGVGGLPVSIASTEGMLGRGQSQIGSTFADGSFQFHGLQHRKYNLFAGSDRVGFTYRGGVQPGDDVILTLGPVGRVRLRALDRDKLPLEGARLKIESVNTTRVLDFGHFSTTDAQGFVELGLPAGVVGVHIMKGTLHCRVNLDVPPGETFLAEVLLQ